MEDTKQREVKKESFVHNFLHFYRNRAMNILVILAVILYFVLQLSIVVPKEMQRCVELLTENLEQAELYQKYGEDANELYLTIQDQDYLSACQFFIESVEDGMSPKTCVDRLNSILEECNTTFYLKSNGDIISSADRDSLSLSEEEMNQLLAEGILQCEDSTVRYYALSCGDDYLILRRDEAYAEQFSMDMLKLVSLNGFVYNNKTLYVVEADEEDIPKNISQMYFGDAIEIENESNTDIEFKYISPYNSGIQKYTNMKLAAIQPMNNLSKYTICTYIPISEIASNILVKSGLPTLLCLGFIALSIFASLHFRKVLLKDNGSEEHSKSIKLPFNCFINVKLARQILFMQLFMGLLVIFCSSILMTLSRFSSSYENAKYSLEELASTEETCQDALNECWNMYSNPAIGMAELTCKYLQTGDVVTDLKVQKNLSNLVDSTFLDKISVYDRNGECVYTTDTRVGYPLGTDPSSTQYSFWSLLEGDKEYILTRSDSNDGTLYCAMKRRDEVGIVVLSFSDQGFGDLEQKLSIESIASNVYYRNSCIFVDRNVDSNTGNLAGDCYQISKNGSKITCDNPNLPILSDMGSFCGFRTIGGIQYFVVGLGGSEHSSFYLIPVSEITAGLSSSIVTYVVFLLIICFFDFVGCAIYTTETIDEEVKEKEKEETKKHRSIGHNLIRGIERRVQLSNVIADSQKTIWKHGLYSTVALIVITLLLDLALNRNSLISFLFNGQWERNVNLFALTTIVLTILATCLLFRIMEWFFNELIKNFPPQYAAAVQMIHSVLKIVIIVWLIVFSANEVGIDTATILASVGIGGLALGIAAKDTINDMLNGIFIIMDGRIHVGDFVEVNGFYGQIVKIGIRTTKIQRFNQEKSINNSDMKNILNRSRGQSSIYIKFRVGHDTDIAALKELIESSTDRFQEACRGKLIGNASFLGVDSFDADSICCCMYILVDEKYRINFTRRCNLVLLNLLNEHGISVGSDLIVEADDGRKIKFIGKRTENTENKDKE